MGSPGGFSNRRPAIRPMAELVAANPDGVQVGIETLAKRCVRAHARLIALDRPAGQPDVDILTAEAAVAASGAAAALVAGSVEGGPVVDRLELVQSAHCLIDALWATREHPRITRRWQ